MNKELYLCFAKQGELFFTERKAKDVMCTDWDKRFDECNPSFIKNEIYGRAKKIKIYRDYIRGNKIEIGQRLGDR